MKKNTKIITHEKHNQIVIEGLLSRGIMRAELIVNELSGLKKRQMLVEDLRDRVRGNA